MSIRTVRAPLVLAACLLTGPVAGCRGDRGDDAPVPAPPTPSSAGRAAEVVAAMIEAHGGLDAWRSLRDVHYLERRVRFGDEEEPATTSERDIYLKRRGGDWMVRIELALGGRLEQIGPDGFPAGGFIVSEPIVMGYDGEEYWETRGGRRVTEPDVLRSTRFIVAAWRYWFLVPFALADPGVKLAYGGEEILDGKPVHIVDVTFGEDVGDNPEDVYRYYVNRETHMVENLRYRMKGRPRYREFRMQDYQPLGGILHDTMRRYYTHQGVNDGYKELEIRKVNSDLPDELFRAPRPGS